MLDLDLTTVAFEFINFLVLTALLYRFLFQPVMRRVHARAATKDQLMFELEQDRQQAAEMKAEWESRLANVDEEAAAIITAAMQQAEADRMLVIQQTQSEVEHILAEAHCDAHRLRQHTMDEFHNDLVNTVLNLSSQIIARSAPPELHDILVRQLSEQIWQLGQDDVQQVETIRRSLTDRAPTAFVTAAFPLSEEQRNQLLDTLTALVDHKVTLKLQTEPALVAGLRVRLGDTLIDNSIADQLLKLRKGVSNKLKRQAVRGLRPASTATPDALQQSTTEGVESHA